MESMIGATIALISKSDIRYVGTLHQVDKTNATVSLQNVRSFGTEGRIGDPKKELPPSPQVFNLIMFKGSDIKDLSVIDAAPAVPPAPIGKPTASTVSVDAQQQHPYLGGFPYQGFPPQNMPFHMMPPNMNPFFMQQQMPSHFGHPNNFWPHQMPPHPNAANMPNFGAYPPAVPAPPAKPDTSVDQSKPDTPSGLDSVTKNFGSLNMGTSPATPVTPESAVSKPPASSGLAKPLQSEPEATKTTKITKENASRPTTAVEVTDKPKITSIMEQQRQSRPQPPKEKMDYNEYTKQAEQGDRERRFTENRERPRRGRGGGPGHATTTFRTNVPKSDFDFERANAKFHKEDLAAEQENKLALTSPTSPSQINGASSATGTVIPPVSYYSKSSFFDDISCDAKDRNTANDPSFDRRAKMYEDRCLNLETFGQVSVGRGRYNNSNRGRGGRGGYYNNNRRGGYNKRDPKSSTGADVPDN